MSWAVDLPKEVPMKRPEQSTWTVTRSAIVHARNATRRRVAFSMRHSSPKLPQMVIRMQVSPAHPIFRCHCPEYWMGQAWLGQTVAKPAQRRKQRSEILTKTDRYCTPSSLFNLRPGGYSRGPLHRRLQGAPLQQCSLHEARRRARGLFSQRNLVGVIQMANHLVDRHGSPARLILRRQLRQSKGKALLFAGVHQCLHEAASLKINSSPGSHHKILRILRSRVMHAVQFVGMDKRRASRPDHSGLPRNGHRERTLYHQEEFFVLVPMWWVGFASRPQSCLVYFQVITGVRQSVQDWPGFVLPTGNSSKGLMKELRVGLSAANAEDAASSGIACSRARRPAFMEPPLRTSPYRPSVHLKSRRPAASVRRRAFG
jgi:hypothetical protein